MTVKKHGFFRLPRELRDLVYDHYVHETEGYHFDWKSRKLRLKNGRPIDLALMYTCTTVAIEIQGVALGRNVIIFSTSDDDAENHRAQLFTGLILSHEWSEGTILSYPDYITSEIREDMAQKYPELDGLLRGDEHTTCIRHGVKDWGLARSTMVDFMRDLNSLLVTHTDYRSAPDWTYKGQFEQSRPMPWDLLSPEELDGFHMTVGPERYPCKKCTSTQSCYNCKEVNGLKWRYSAASAAIAFLRALHPSARRCLRRVVLLEDHISVPRPESHARGLIPFCSENPNLRVERRVAFWRTVMMDPRIIFHAKMQCPLDEFFRRDGSKSPRCITENNFAPWILEVLALKAAGMPQDSFTLVFDGDPIPERSSEVFEIVKQDAAWQMARDSFIQQLPNRVDWQERREGARDSESDQCYFGEGFPEAIQKIVEGRFFIRCNFPIGDLFDPGFYFRKYRHLRSLEDWDEALESVRKDNLRITTAPPLPTLFELYRETGLIY